MANQVEMPNPYPTRVLVKRYKGHDGEAIIDIMDTNQYEFHYSVHQYVWMADTQEWTFNKSICCMSLEDAQIVVREILG